MSTSEALARQNGHNKPTDSREASVMQSFTVLREWADRVIEELPEMSDEKIADVCRQAGELEAQAFRIRGAGAIIIRERIAQRLTGGRGRRDTDGVGIRAQLANFAAELKVDVSTVEKDARIVERFGDRETFSVDAQTLGREFFAVALGAPNPDRAIDLALEKKALRPGYSVREFSADVRVHREAHRHGEEPPDVTLWQNVAFTEASLAAISRLRDRRPRSSLSDVVVEAVLALDRAERNK